MSTTVADLQSFQISVVIPVRNGSATLERCLKSIRSQTLKGVEIVILDSASTDDSVSLCRKFGARIVAIDENSFNHGLTRNIGVKESTGELIFFTVQDAWLAEDDLLEKMTKHFHDAYVMAVCGHQAVPHEQDKNPLKWYRRFSQPKVEKRCIEQKSHFEKMSQSSQKGLIAWDNVVSVYRKVALEKLPFADTQMSEDWIWSRSALLQGWTLVYDPSLVVYHYHHETFRYIYRLTFSVNYHFHKFFGFVPELPDVVIPAARATWHLAKHPSLPLGKKIYWIVHNYRIIIARLLSTADFLFFIKAGGSKGILKRYRKLCQNIPQGKQNSNK